MEQNDISARAELFIAVASHLRMFRRLATAGNLMRAKKVLYDYKNY